jgi:uncharacterized membrane protein YeiB
MHRRTLPARPDRLVLLSVERGLALVGMLTAAVVIAALVAAALLSAMAASAVSPNGIELAPFRWDPRTGTGA